LDNNVGSIQIGIEFDFLDLALTNQSILEGTLGLNQSLKTTDVTYFPEKKFLMIDCDVYEQLLN
jgi:hypothetical protein